MPAKIRKQKSDLVLTGSLVGYWALLFIVSLWQGPPEKPNDAVFPLLVLAGLPMFLLAARILVQSAQQEDAHLAYTDDLTGIANRRAFVRDASFAIRRAKPGTVGLIILDVDGLKQRNDSCGHQAGDELLALLAKRFESLEGRLYRIGGDEFAVLIRRVEGEAVTPVSRRLDEAWTEEFQSCGHTHEIHVEYGVSSNRSDDSFESLFRRADDRLLEQKRQKKPENLSPAAQQEPQDNRAAADATPRLRLLG